MGQVRDVSTLLASEPALTFHDDSKVSRVSSCGLVQHDQAIFCVGLRARK